MKKEELTAKIREYNGNLSAVARSMKVSRQAVYNNVERFPEAQQALAESRETMLDNAESVLYKEVLAGNMTALIFFLKTQGRTRGYYEKQEISGTIRTIEVDLSDDGSDPTAS